MSTFRRVVTRHDRSGKSVPASDETVADFGLPGMPGLRICDLWGADALLRFPDAGARPPYRDFFPPPGGFRLLEFTIPPDAAGSAGAGDAPAGDIETVAPGLAATMTPGAPGMHRSATVDLLYFIEGRCLLELDDGSQTEMRAGDVAVQNGTMHAWRNPYDRPCRVLAVTIGAEQVDA